jgi:hypothetical protein
MLTLRQRTNIDTRIILLPLLFFLGYVVSLVAFSRLNPITLVANPLTIISHGRSVSTASTHSNPVPIPPPFVMTVPRDGYSAELSGNNHTVGGNLSSMIMMMPSPAIASSMLTPVPSSPTISPISSSMTSAPGLGGDGAATMSPSGSLPTSSTGGMTSMMSTSTGSVSTTTVSGGTAGTTSTATITPTSSPSTTTTTNTLAPVTNTTTTLSPVTASPTASTPSTPTSTPVTSSSPTLTTSVSGAAPTVGVSTSATPLNVGL